MQLCLLVVASANKLCQWEMQHELWRVLSMHVVYLVVFAVVNAGCVCWLKNQQSIVVVEIVATRTVEAVVLLCLVVEKSIEEQYSTNGSCRNCGNTNCVCQLWQFNGSWQN